MDAPTFRRKARPARFRVSIRHETKGIYLFRHRQKTWAVGLALGVFFVIFAAIAWQQFQSVRGRGVKDIAGLSFALFEWFWLIGWSVGVVILGSLTLLLFLTGDELWRIDGDRLIHQSRIRPFWIINEYDIAHIRNLSYEKGTIRFVYGDGQVRLGSNLPAREFERILALIHQTAGAASQAPEPTAPVVSKPSAPSVPRPTVSEKPAGWTAPSTLCLIAANLVPLAGVLFLGWNLGELMLLFWSESAIVGFYNVMKLIVVGRLAAIFTVPFFIGHYGGFMSAHFMFVYFLFIQGGQGGGTSAGVYTVLVEMFGPLWPALLSLFISHGISFWTNFIGNQEHVGRTTSQQMQEPYKRIMIMHVTIIFGGWFLMLLGTPLPALVLLIILKIAVDTRAHQREHTAAPTLSKGKKGYMPR